MLRFKRSERSVGAYTPGLSGLLNRTAVVVRLPRLSLNRFWQPTDTTPLLTANALLASTTEGCNLNTMDTEHGGNVSDVTLVASATQISCQI
jgi:hypothetical protein